VTDHTEGSWINELRIRGISNNLALLCLWESSIILAREADLVLVYTLQLVVVHLINPQ